MSAARTTYLDLVKLVDSFPYTADANQSYYRLILPGSDLARGWIHPDIESRIPWTDQFEVDHQSRTVRLLLQPTHHDQSKAVSAALQGLVDELISRDTFKCLAARHSELFEIPGHGCPAVIERFATSLFGIPTRGAHMTVYCRGESNDMRIWVPRRSQHVGHWKNKLDSTVAGGVAAAETPMENIIREAAEEASLPEALVRERVVPAGVLTYIGLSKGEDGWEEGKFLPDVVCVYDLEVDQDVVPRPHDDEVKDFHLMSIEEVKRNMLAGEFKPNSAVVMLDFFIRHGIVTYETERDFVEIVQRMHRRLPVRVSM